MASKKYWLEYEEYEDEGKTSVDLITRIVEDPELPKLDEVIIGCFGPCYDNESEADNMLDELLAKKEHFKHVKSLFVGDMESEECEISWIWQSEKYGEVLKALPKLEKLTVQGGNGLGFAPLEHENLKSLTIICGGLPKNVIEELAASKLPNLESLIVYVGVDEYGFDGNVSDFAKVCRKELFPKLKTLGIVNSEEEDKVVELVLASDLVSQLEEILFSCGVLTDEGGKLILDQADQLKHLKKMDLTYHYLSEEMMEKLKGLPFEVVLDDPQAGDDDCKYPMLTE